MKKIYFLIVFYFIVLNHHTIVFSNYISANDVFSFISPVPNSELNSVSTNIILKSKDINIIKDLFSENFIITGSKSGIHNGNILISDNGNTLIFKPNTIFNPGEIVYVKINGISFPNNKKASISFKFKTATQKINFNFSKYYKNEFGLSNNYYLQNNINPTNFTNILDTLPPDFPHLTVLQNNNPTQGNIYLSDFPFDSSNHTASPYLMVINNLGIPIWYKKMTHYCFDFKPQNQNIYTYFDGFTQKFYSFDSSYNLIDSFECGNGYVTDVHELRLLSNGHVLLLGDDPESIDMSKIVSGGSPNAAVLGIIIQELDKNKNVVWQWRTWDHYKITDATHENLTDTIIDYVHANAIEIDKDGNILMSCRHMDEITKIDYETGSIVWRLSGKNNQFTFINDSIQLSHQHAIRVLPNGNFTIFDNGNFHTPHVSRAVEYQINENTKTCTLVWEYRNPLNTFGAAMGYVQRLSTGNTLIGWGAASPCVTEVNTQGQKVLELSFPQGFFSYRAVKFEPGEFNTPQINDLPFKYFLKQNFPNPFNPETIIEYYIPVNTFVNLNVYDLTGRLVTKLVNDFQSSGSHAVVFDSKNFSSGIYFYSIVANNFKDTKKLVILK